MNEEQRVLSELAPYELGEGWPYRPGEKSVCRSLVKLGMLAKRGRCYAITECGRAAAGALGLAVRPPH